MKGGLMGLLSLDHLVNTAKNPKGKVNRYYDPQTIVDYIDKLIQDGEFPEDGVPVDILGQWMEEHYRDGKKLSYGRTSNKNALTEAVRALKDKVKRLRKTESKLSWIVPK